MEDTSVQARRVQVALLRRAGARRRAAIASGLTGEALWRARRGIALARPDLSDLEQRLLFVEVHYGRDLAERVRRYLESRAARP